MELFLGQVDVVKILIEHGANVNAKDKDTRSPLDYLSMNEIRNGKLCKKWKWCDHFTK